MRKGDITISQKELTRYDVLRRVLDETVSLTDAAVCMGVGYRHAKRLAKKAQEGLGALAHGNRGRSPSNKVCDEVRERIVGMSHGCYGTFNDTHLTEELAKQGLAISRESVRNIRRQAGIAPKGKHRPRR